MESTRENLPERLRWFHRNPDKILWAPIVEAADEIDALRAALSEALSNLDHIVEAQVRAAHNLK